MNFRLISLMPLIPVLAVVSHAQKLEYRKIFAQDTTAISVTISRRNDGYNYRIESTSTGGTITEEAVLGKDGSTRQWRYANGPELLSINSRLQNGVISLDTKKKGKTLAKTLKPAEAWHQLFPYDMLTFVTAASDTTEFEAVGLFGPGALKLGRMQGVKLGDETIRVGNAECECLRVRVALAGIMARFWHADYWFRKGDGRFVQGSWVEKTGAKPSVVSLVKEDR